MIWKNNSCNECNSIEYVKAILVGNYNLLLCSKCRRELSELLKQDSESK